MSGAAAVVATTSRRTERESAKLCFEDLYRDNRDDVFAYAAGMLRDRSAAEEVTSVAFEKAYRRRHQFDARRGSARGWLFGIARNAALDELRRRKRIAASSEDTLEGSAPDPGEQTVRRQTVEAAMATLSPRERELVSLRFYAGLGNAEIAAALGISESNAGTKLHRAMEKLRRSCNEAD